MKEKLQNKYLAWGLTAFSVLGAVVLLFFAIYRSHYIFTFIRTILTIMMPFIYGLVIAYVMNPVVKFFDNKVYSKLVKKIVKNKEKDYHKLVRVLSLITSSLLFIGVLVTCLSFLFPEILKSLEMIVKNINTYLSNSKELLINLFGGSEQITIFINEKYGRFS